MTIRAWLNLFDLLFSFFRSGGVVRNYQAKLIRDFLLLGVVQKQMKSPMNGFVLLVNNYLENQFSTKKTPSTAAKPYFSSRAYCKLKTSVAASRNMAWFSKRDVQLLHYFKTEKLHGPVVIKEGFICKHCRVQHKKNLIDRSFTFYLSV